MNLSSIGGGEGPAVAPIGFESRGGAVPMPPMAMMDPSGRITFGIGNGGGLLGGFLGGGDPNATPRPATALPVKCPVCNKVTPYASATSAGGGSVTDTRLEERCSHHARTMFVSASCPVCMEDNVGPPMVRWRMCVGVCFGVKEGFVCEGGDVFVPCPRKDVRRLWRRISFSLFSSAAAVNRIFGGNNHQRTTNNRSGSGAATASAPRTFSSSAARWGRTP